MLQQDVFSALGSVREKADLIFMDPPYGQGMEKQVLARLFREAFVTNDTLIMIEAALPTDFSFVEELGFTLIREKRYKTNKHMFLRRSMG